MTIWDLIKSKKERDKERLRNERQAKRKAESAIDSGNERIVLLRKQNDETWKRAQNYLKSGQKMSARREVEKYRATELMIDQLERKNWICERYICRLDNAQADNLFAEAMTAFTKVVDIDPEKIIEAMDGVEEKLEEQTEIDRYWEKLHNKELSKMANKDEEMIPPLDEMMKTLESEVAHSVSDVISNPSDSEILDEISTTREEIEKMLSENSSK